MREIKLACGTKAYVSEEDYERVTNRRWMRCGSYAMSVIRPRTYLHRFIMQPPADRVVHHKDNNGLNCTRENMQVCTQGENVKQRTYYKRRR